jgi:hypothetical protein
VKRIRIDRPRARHDRPWREVLPPGPRDPDVVRAKALARARSANARQQDLRGVAEQRHRCKLQDHPHPASRRTGLGARP